MRVIFLVALFFGIAVAAFGQSGVALTEDFFIGTWTDSTKDGIMLTKEKRLLLVRNELKNGFDHVEPSEITWTYNLVLEKKPIAIELTCEHCDGKSVPKKVFGQIEVINNRQIYFMILDQSGKIKDRLLLTKN